MPPRSLSPPLNLIPRLPPCCFFSRPRVKRKSLHCRFVRLPRAGTHERTMHHIPMQQQEKKLRAREADGKCDEP